MESVLIEMELYQRAYNSKLFDYNNLYLDGKLWEEIPYMHTIYYRLCQFDNVFVITVLDLPNFLSSIFPLLWINSRQQYTSPQMKQCLQGVNWTTVGDKVTSS